jgi:hypothetical protein
VEIQPTNLCFRIRLLFGRTGDRTKESVNPIMQAAFLFYMEYEPMPFVVYVPSFVFTFGTIRQ